VERYCQDKTEELGEISLPVPLFSQQNLSCPEKDAKPGVRSEKESTNHPRNTTAMLINILQKLEISPEVFSFPIDIYFPECEISSSHGGEYDIQNFFLGCTAV
jgi:hypothetical protein